MNKFYEIKGKYVIVFTVLFLVFMVFVLPYIARLSDVWIGSFGSPDTNFSFDLSLLKEMRELYGVDGRRNYIILRWTFDIVWPVVYTLFYLSVTGYLSNNTDSTIKWLYIPLLAVIFDLFENILATIYMGFYPNDLEFIGLLLIGSSMFKWLYVSLSFVTILYLLIKFAYIKIKRP